jgi:hypothetical protein
MPPAFARTSRRGTLLAVALAIATCSGAARSEHVTPSVHVDDARRHRALLAMSMSNPQGEDCVDGVPPKDSWAERGSFHLYDDGLVIYTPAHRCETMQAHIAPGEARALVERIVESGFLELPGFDWARCTDQPRVEIMLRQGDRWFGATVEGIDRYGEPLDDHCRPGPAGAAFVTALAKLTHFAPPDPAPFAPREFVVHLDRGEPQPNELGAQPVPWPSGLPLPAITDPDRPHEEIYDIALLAQSAVPVSAWRRSYVVIGDVSYSYARTAVVPEYAYLQRVERALRDAWWSSRQ